MMALYGKRLQKSDSKTMKEIIHSGHFMVSDIDDPEVQEGEEDNASYAVHESDCDQESLPLPAQGFDFESACQETSKTYTFGSRSVHSISIDASLTKLFECMTLAYSGKLTSPRWKQFKGLKLRLKEKIRLNNMIWRAWHMQFILKLKTDKLCQFATPLDSDTHLKPESIVIEGTYWKRRMANIKAEYQKWRLFYRDQTRKKTSQEADDVSMDFDTRWPSWPKDFSSLQSAMDEDFIMDFSDTLFTTLNPSQPFDFPNPREIAAKAGIADFIQPGLVQLQPSVDDFMDTLEPITDLFSDFLNSKLPPLPPLPEETTFNSSNFSDVMSGSSDQQQLYPPPKTNFNRTTSSNLYNSSSSPQTTSSGRRINFRKPVLSKSLPPRSISPPFARGKTMLESLNVQSSSTAGISPLENETVPSLSQERNLQSETDSMQAFLCNSIISQSQENSAIASLLQRDLQSSICSMQPTQESLATNLNSGQPLKQQLQQPASTNSYFPQQTFLPKTYDNNTFAQQLSQVRSPVQVPLQNLQMGLSSSAPAEDKNATQQLYFSVNLAQLNQTVSPPPSFKVPAQVSGGAVQQGSPGASNSESSAHRRHSYTTGQNVQPAHPGDYMSTRRSRLIAPAAPSKSFAVPEVPQTRLRTRSRSVSSPQSNSPKPATHQPLQAVSLTDINSPFQSVIASPDSPSRRTSSSDSIAQPVSVTNSSILPQNAVLAQLLSPGCTQQSMNQALVKVTSAPSASSTSPVTIIRPLLSTTAHTFVFSSLPIQTQATPGNDLQRNLLMGATNQMFSSQNSPPACVLPTPDSPGSSTCSSSPAVSTASLESVPSSSKSTRLKSDKDKTQYKEHRRVCHINAEQKRRCNIKNGFESLHNLLPSMVGQSPTSKISKAAMLQKGADYIRTLKTERQQQLEEAELLRKQIDELNEGISLYQSQLPASGAPIPCQRTNRMKEMFEEYVRQQTNQNWKFWIFSLIVEPLVDSFNSNVSTASVDEMCKSILTWLDQHCSLVSLRPGVLNSLRHLSTSTNILSDPSCMPEEAARAVTKKEKRK